MTRAGWEPTTEAEVALYEALLAGDQERYFRALARAHLLLPVSADAVAGRSPMGWATWTSNDHTHLLAFTSTASMRTCLAEHAGAARQMAFAELASAWPNNDWWLAVNPGLPIEGYLPAWFVVQLSHGDARLPGQASSAPRDRLARVEALERAKAARAAGHQPPRDSREPVRVSATVGPRALPSAPPPPPAEPFPPQSPSQTPWHDPTPWRNPAPPAWHDPAGPGAARRDQGPAWADSAPAGSGAVPREQAPAVWPEPTPAAWHDSPGPGAARREQGPAVWPGQASYRDPAPAADSRREQAPAASGREQGRAAWRDSAAPAAAPWLQPPPAEVYPASAPVRREAGPAAWREPAADAAEPSGGPRAQPAPAAWTRPAATQGAEPAGPPGQPASSAPPSRQSAPAAWHDPAALAAAESVAAALRNAAEPGAAAWRQPTVVANPTELPRRQPGGASAAPPWQEPAAPGQSWHLPAAQARAGTAEPAAVPHAAAPVDSAPGLGTGAETPALWRDPSAPDSAGEATRSGAAAFFWGNSAARSAPPDAPTRSATDATSPSETAKAYRETARVSGEAARSNGATAEAGRGGLVEPAATTAPGPQREPAAQGEQRGINGAARHAEPDPNFVPANSVEEQLFEAAEAGNTDAFLSTLLLATVLIPKSAGTTNGAWRPQPIDGEPHIVCYTSTQHLAEPLETVSIKFIKLITEWPDPTWSFAVNPGTPVGATLPGGQLLALANWAAEVGLGGDDDEQELAPSDSRTPATVPVRANPELTVLQKAIAPSQVSYYLERGYDRVSGFVHRAHEVGHLEGIERMRAALGLDWPGSPFAADATEIYLLRWPAYRPNLYRIPYGGNHEAGMKAMQGWVIERAPFRGNGFAPGESKEIIAEFKVDSARLPHGARLLRMRKDGTEETVAVLDADGQRWLRQDGG